MASSSPVKLARTALARVAPKSRMAPSAIDEVLPVTAFDAQLPFQRFNSVMKLFSALPTLPLGEWCARYVFAACASHALTTGNVGVFASSVVSPLVSALLSEIALKGQNDLIYPSAATVMLAPRRPLYRLEMYAAAFYCAAVASKRGYAAGATQPLAQAALAGILAHLFLAPAEVNGPRFLWWSYHDDVPSMRHRVLTAPVSTFLYALTMGFSNALVSRWMFSGGSESNQIHAAIAARAHWAPEHNRALLESIGHGLDRLRNSTFNAPMPVKVVLTALLCAPLHAGLTAGFELFALDRVGEPSDRAYKLALAALALSAHKLAVMEPPETAQISGSGGSLSAAVAAYFALQAAIAMVGEPAKHVSTGIHQAFGRRGVTQKDGLGNQYERYLSGDGPSRSSAFDFRVEGVALSEYLKDLDGKRDALEDVRKFMRVADKRIADTEAALKDAQAWASAPARRIPTLKADDVLLELDASNTVRLARIRMQLETRLERLRGERGRLAHFETQLTGKIARLEAVFEESSIDASGNTVVQANEHGPNSVWYTIRGVKPSAARAFDEKTAVALISALGVVAFTKALALAST